MGPTEHADTDGVSPLSAQLFLLVETACYPMALIDGDGTRVVSSSSMERMVAKEGTGASTSCPDWMELCKLAPDAPESAEVTLRLDGRSMLGTISAIPTSRDSLYLLQLAAPDQVGLEALAYGIHDARTELQSISAAAGLIAETDQESGATRTNLSDRITQASAAVLEILNDMLTTAPSGHPPQSADNRGFSVGKVIEEIAFRLEPLARRQGSHILFHSEHSAICSATQRKPVESIVRNLVGNAVKFTQNGAITIKLTEELQGNPLRCAVKIEVADTGKGMSADDRHYMLNPDARRSSSQPREGRTGGVGSQIIRSALEDLDGQLTVKSHSRTGTQVTVTFCLPVIVSGDADTEHKSQTSEHAPDLDPLRDARILVVEDNDTNRVLFVQLLTKNGAKVEAVENGALALDRLASGGAVDLVLMDLAMPVKDGLDLACALLVGNPLEQRPTLVGLSGEIDEKWQAACLRAGMQDVLLKPISPGALRQRLAILLAARRTSGPSAPPPVVAENMVEDLYEDLGQDETHRLMRAALAQTAALVARMDSEGFSGDVYKEIHSALGALGLTGLARLDDRLRIVQAVSRIKPADSPAMQDVMVLLRQSLAETTAELGD